MKTKTPTHTPAPWAAHTHNNPDYIDIDAGAHRITSLDLDAARQCEPPYSDAEIWANARLIASAPDLLASLREFVYGEAHGLGEINAMLARGRAAISKAEGR